MDVVQLIVGAGIVLGVVAFVAWPMVARRPRAAAAGVVIDDDRVEGRILEYRAALRRRTLCESCLFPNVADARYCAECGSRLAAPNLADAHA